MDNMIEKEVDFFKKKVSEYKEAGKTLFVTSSFQTHSIPLLHLVSVIDNTIPIYFMNTGFHFPQVHTFKNEIGERFGLRVKNIESPVSKHLQKDENNQFYYVSNPDYCCYLNKTLPTESLLKTHDVWINGVRKDQNANRASMDYEAETPHRAMRFHPMLNWSNKMIFEYIKAFDLPPNPMEALGFLSIGCRPCTEKFNFEDPNSRDGRWGGMKKTECGLHTDLIKK